jgi:hypothetical protein
MPRQPSGGFFLAEIDMTRGREKIEGTSFHSRWFACNFKKHMGATINIGLESALRFGS